MSYEDVFNAISSASDWLVDVFFTSLFNYIKNTPFISACLIASFNLPLLFVILELIFSASSGVADASFKDYEFANNSVKRYQKRKLIHDKKLLKEERELQQVEASNVAREFFKNNPSRMSVNINGFRFVQEGFEKKHWNNHKKTYVTKKFNFDSSGNMYTSNVSVRSTESYDNTSDFEQENNFDAD